MAMVQGGGATSCPAQMIGLSVQCRETGVEAGALLAAIHCGRLCCGHHCGEAKEKNAGNKRRGDERNAPVVRGVNFVAMSEDIRKTFVIRDAIFRSAPTVWASSKAAHKPSPSVDISPVTSWNVSTKSDNCNRKISTKSDFLR
ncbi:hypothetical protein [Brucella sp. 10RB9213]|uniref:hypothetical protein n=1 Tax=Brucella sp. 10RB9213 TaxID=1844039 RepID=UPI0012ADE4D9|nr:hypothetical protein [Brucella sp. 10RB9213]MRN67986.1 hypothetical protein [Brucella sp. 10RB9213]